MHTNKENTHKHTHLHIEKHVFENNNFTLNDVYFNLKVKEITVHFD